MLFVIDLGNTNIKCGIFDGDKLLHSWRLGTKIDRTADELGIKVVSFFNYLGIDTEKVEDIIVSSVIPSINYTVEHMCRIYFHKKPYFVEPGIKTGINILYDNPKELGSDRIVNAVAAYVKYGGPCITVDFGTATSYGAVSAKGEFLGGAICPGVKISAEALMQSGLLYGYVGQVDYILRKMKAELGGSAKVVATGGLADVIAQETKTIDVIDSLLTLEGLKIIYHKNVEK